MQIISDSEFLMLYSMNDSYIWQCKKQIMEAFDLLSGLDMYNTCAILDEFIRNKD